MNGTRIWDSWCRLCAKENGNQVNVLVKSEETCGTDLSQIIQKYFNVEITSYEYAPNSICFQCDKFVSDLVTFSERTKKVQNLFTELEYIDKDPFNGDISALREKYGVNHEKNLYDDLEGFLEEHIQAENKKRKRRGRKPTSVVADEEEQVMELEQVEAIGEDCLEVKIIKDESNEIFNIAPKDQETYTKSEQDPTVSVPEDEFDDNDDVNDSDYDDADYSENENDEKYSLDEDALIKEEFLENPSKPMKFNCDSCDKSYNKETLLRRHMNQHHDVPCDLKFSCTICDKSFTKDTHRRRHEKTVHKTGDQTETVYPCPFCDKKFQKAPNVKTHIKVVHSTEKPYICEECGKAFKTIGALKEHKYTHTEECPFQCSSCDKRFKNRARLKTHEDTHKDTTYVCTICGLQLNTRFSWQYLIILVVIILIILFVLKAKQNKQAGLIAQESAGYNAHNTDVKVSFNAKF